MTSVSCQSCGKFIKTTDPSDEYLYSYEAIDGQVTQSFCGSCFSNSKRMRVFRMLKMFGKWKHGEVNLEDAALYVNGSSNEATKTDKVGGQ